MTLKVFIFKRILLVKKFFCYRKFWDNTIKSWLRFFLTFWLASTAILRSCECGNISIFSSFEYFKGQTSFLICSSYFLVHSICATTLSRNMQFMKKATNVCHLCKLSSHFPLNKASTRIEIYFCRKCLISSHRDKALKIIPSENQPLLQGSILNSHSDNSSEFSCEFH